MSERDRNGHHIVRRTVLDFEYQDEGQAFRARPKIDGLLQHALLPGTEAALDAFDAGTGAIHIGRLDVDLGRFDPSRVDVSRLRELARARLAECLTRLPVDGSEASTVPLTVALEDGFVQFLSYGALPWHSPVRDVAELQRELQKLPATVARGLIRRSYARMVLSNARYRLIHQFSQDFYRWYVTAAGAMRWDLLAGLPWGSAPGSIDAAATRRRVLAAIGRLALQKRAVTLASLRRASAKQHVPGGSTSENLPTTRSPAEPTEAPSEYYVSQAGIVILHPFLERFFGTLGLLDDRGTFKSRREQERAVHLLYFLSTGSEAPSEHDLVLQKVVCAWPLHTAIGRDIDLRDEEKAEGVRLLEAVIGHWTKLGNTSVEGFRESFLRRDGRLLRSDRGWELAVESRSIDVLLDHLDWTISIVKLPWLVEPVWIDWR